MPVVLGNLTESDHFVRQDGLEMDILHQNFDSRRSGPLDLHSRSGAGDGLSLINYLSNGKYVM